MKRVPDRERAHEKQRHEMRVFQVEVEYMRDVVGAGSTGDTGATETHTGSVPKRVKCRRGAIGTVHITSKDADWDCNTWRGVGGRAPDHQRISEQQ